MSFRLTRILAHAAAAAALAVAVQAQAYNEVIDEVIDDTPSAEAMTFDLLIMRPLGLVGTVTGVVVFVLALPVNLITSNFAEPARRLIVEPARFTFARDLGALD